MLALDGPDWSIEFSIGDETPIRSITLHVRGGDEVLSAVAPLPMRSGHEFSTTASPSSWISAPMRPRGRGSGERTGTAS